MSCALRNYNGTKLSKCEIVVQHLFDFFFFMDCGICFIRPILRALKSVTVTNHAREDRCTCSQPHFSGNVDVDRVKLSRSEKRMGGDGADGSGRIRRRRIANVFNTC